MLSNVWEYIFSQFFFFFCSSFYGHGITRSGPTFISDTQKYSTILLITKDLWEFPGGPGLGLCTLTAGGPGSIPGPETKITQALRCGQKNFFFNSKNKTKKPTQKALTSS